MLVTYLPKCDCKMVKRPFYFTGRELEKVKKSSECVSLNFTDFEKIAIFTKFKSVGNFCSNSDLAENYWKVFLKHTWKKSNCTEHGHQTISYWFELMNYVFFQFRCLNYLISIIKGIFLYVWSKYTSKVYNKALWDTWMWS